MTSRSLLRYPGGLIGAAVVLAVSLAGCAPTTQPGTPATTAPSPSASPTPSPTLTPPTAGTWKMLPSVSLPEGLRNAVWTGTEFIVHQLKPYPAKSGTIDVAYSPSTGKWRQLSSSPYTITIMEGGNRAIWDGSEMLTFGEMNAAYNPATNRWRPLTPPLALGPAVVAWTGHQVLYWAGGCCASVNKRGIAYDPATDSWRQLPTAPLPAGFGAGGAWTGTELIVFGGSDPLEPGANVITEAAAYNPTTNTWRRLASLPAPRMEASITWTGKEILVVGGLASWTSTPYSDGVAYNPATNTWRTLPKMETPRAGHVAVWTGHYLLVWGGYAASQSNGNRTSPPHGLAYDPVANRWFDLPVAPLRGRSDALAAWTGDALLIWGGTINTRPYTDLLDGATYRP